MLKMKMGKRDTPWEHLYFLQVFDPPQYARVLMELPGLEDYTPLEGYAEHRSCFALSDSKSRFWKEINDALCDPAFQGALFKLLGITKPAWPKVGLIHDKPGYSIKRHTDASYKVATILIYLPRNNDNRFLGTALENDDRSYSKQLGFFPNTGFAFAITPHTWHHVPVTDAERDLLVVCYFDTPDREFK